MGENFTVNIGSAGSISLLLQSILLPAMFAEKKVSLKIFGGTNVEWSPPIEFFQEVLFPIVSQMGAKFELKLIKRGYYPKGKGIASFSSQKSFLPLKPLNLVSRGELDFIKIFSHCANLPKEVAVNQFSSAKKELQRLNVGIDSVIDCSEKSNTIGSGITIIGFFSDGAKISGSALGKKGIPAVKIGKEAAQIFLKEFDVGKPVDSHLADQLIPFMAIAKGTSKISTTFLTEHTLNNIETVKKFLPCEIKVNGKLNECAEIEVKGAGLK